MGEDLEKEVLKKEYPTNSHVKRQTPSIEEPPKNQKIVTGTAKKQKKSLSRRFAETFLEDDSKSVGQYILHDVLIPAAKSMLSDMIGGGLDMMLFGERRRGGYSGSSIRRDGGRTVVNYGAFSRGDQRESRDPRDRRREISRGARARFDFDEVVLETRGEAENVLAHLVDLTIDYGMASVADLYELCDIETNFTDNKYGWNDLRGASVTRARSGGYLLNLPRPQPID